MEFGSDMYRMILDQLHDGVYFVDTERLITYWNAGAERIAGFSAGEVRGLSCADNILRHIDEQGNELCLNGCPLHGAMGDGKPREAEVFLHHRLGHRVPVRVRVTPIRDERGTIIGAAEIFTENAGNLRMRSDMRVLEERAHTDALTGIGNRTAGERALATRLWELKNHGTPFGVLFVDIDRFKSVNDTLGHAAGDRVLAMTARSISTGLRGGDMVCRWGGEEFLVILRDVGTMALAAIAERTRVFVEKSWIDHDGRDVRVTVSVGGATAREGDTEDSIVERADRRMYEAKKAGRNRVVVEELP